MSSSTRNKVLVIAILGAFAAVGFVAHSVDQRVQRIRVHDGRADILQDGRVVWTSPQNWRVEDMQRGDVNGDGVADLVALVDAPGEYGKLKPFWVMENDPSVRQHLYIFDIVDGIFHPVWMTSRIFAPTCSFRLRQILDNGRAQLVTLDGDSTAKKDACATPNLSTWDWDGWGFSKVSGATP